MLRSPLERPSSINGPELIRTLELMGLTLHHRAGPYRVFLNRVPGERVLFLTEGWDLPAEDVEWILEQNGLSVERFGECYESLFRN